MAAVGALPFAASAQAVQPEHVGGEVMFVSGRAELLRANGQAVAVSKGLALLEGDEVRTQADSHVYVRMRDGGLLVVRPASELHVDRWRFDASRPQDSEIKYTLENGVARHVSGQGAKAAREKFRFNTPMAAIGVRGTDFTALASPSLTRVTVQSGGVIVNGIGGSCRADGLGPCEGPSAVELFATAKDKLVQVRVGDRRPEVIDANSISPDKLRAPAASEPVAAQPSALPVSVADSRGTDVVNQVIPEKPDPAIAVWGRWASIAAGDTGVVDAQTILKGRNLVAINNLYVLATDSGAQPMALPGDGVAKFQLVTHDGYITDRTGGPALPSTASNASLSVDFGTRRFETSMNVSAGAIGTQIAAKGSVDSSGQFVSDVFATPSTVQGIVGGRDASQAMYLYNRVIDSRYTATGATTWHK